MAAISSRFHSRLLAPNLLRWSIVTIAFSLFGCGLIWHESSLLGIGGIALCLILHRAWGNLWNGVVEHKQQEHQPHEQNQIARALQPAESAERSRNDLNPIDEFSPSETPPKSTDSLVDELLTNARYALLLRPDTKQHLSQQQLMRAIRQLDEAMALVPAGRVLVGQLAELANSACGYSEIDSKLARRNLVTVASIYLDRFCVTNAEFQRFVDAGGYEQLEYWHEEALPALLDFVDQTGAPGPRFWSDGHYPADEPHLPVFGVSWFEAAAYAQWVGKSLPSDAEWTKAAAWPVESAPGRVAQRRYPWGESFDVRKAHLYGSGHKAPVPVEHFPGGVSVGGIHQLIGNVWEWTSTPLADTADPTLHVSESVMSVRGGAFDTYFENQATCHFQSGEHALARRRNIGFRLALPMSELEPPVSSAGDNSKPQSNHRIESAPELAIAND